MSRAIAPQISFADREFIHQRMQLEPPLRAIAAFLDTTRRSWTACGTTWSGA